MGSDVVVRRAPDSRFRRGSDNSARRRLSAGDAARRGDDGQARSRRRSGGREKKSPTSFAAPAPLRCASPKSMKFLPPTPMERRSRRSRKLTAASAPKSAISSAGRSAPRNWKISTPFCSIRPARARSPKPRRSPRAASQLSSRFPVPRKLSPGTRASSSTAA